MREIDVQSVQGTERTAKARARTRRGRSRALGRLGPIAAALAMLASGAAGATPLLSEVYYDASGSDDGELFVELHGAPGTSLEGLVLEGINGSNGAAGPSILLGGVIGTSGLFVLADERSDGTSSVAGADLYDSFDFQNGPDSVVLRTEAGVVLDALGYGEFDPDETFAGEGTPAPDVSAGSSLARLFADVDTDDNAADFVALATPTPGSAAFAVVPEPGAALLLGLGLAGLAVGGRGAGRPRPGSA